MKKVYQASSTLVLICIFLLRVSSPCSLNISPLRKDFRAAKSVFLGKVTSISDYSLSENDKSFIPESWQNHKYFSKVRFEIKNKWKGDVSQNQEFIAVAYWWCGCPGGKPDEFKVGEEFIVFATGKKFITVCDTFRDKLDGKPALIKKLDSFGFRAWARIYPF